VIDEEFDEQMDMQSFFPRIRSQSEMKAECLKIFSEQPVSSLKPSEIFELINNRIKLAELIPFALDLIEQKAVIPIENPYQTPFSILDSCDVYFKTNSVQKNRYDKLKRWENNRGKCPHPKTNEPREGFPDESSAQQFAEDLSDSYSNRMMPHKCDSCGEWHVISEKRHTPSTECEYCRKQLYVTKEAASKRAHIIRNEKGTELKVYQCEYRNGWHLTSRV
jgi:hypothetical protein